MGIIKISDQCKGLEVEVRRLHAIEDGRVPLRRRRWIDNSTNGAYAAKRLDAKGKRGAKNLAAPRVVGVRIGKAVLISLGRQRHRQLIIAGG